MSALLDPGRPEMLDSVLAACGGGRMLHIGAHIDDVVAAYRRRGVHATGLAAIPSTPTGVWRLPYDDGSFDLVCAYGVLDDLPEPARVSAFGELLRVGRRAVLLHASGRPREQWEAECLRQPCRKHPLHQLLVPYGGLDWLTEPAVMLFEPLPADLTLARSVTELAPARDLHMDMLREGGRRADAHVARYMLARQFIRPGDRVLDAACGLGYGSAILADGTLAEHVLGVDVDPWAVQYAGDHYGRQRERLAFDARDLAALDPLTSGSFDAVVSFETLEHIADPDAFLAQCRRLLTPGGRLICSVPNAWVDETGRDPNPYHLHVFDRQKLEALCGRHFLVEQVYGQTAGGGLKLPDAGRAMWPVAAGTPDAEWWLLVGMTTPMADTPAPFRHGLLERPADDRSNVLAFERDYHNPWLARAMVTIGLRTQSTALLEHLADATLATADRLAADAGAALCVKVYRHIDRGDPLDAEILDRIAQYCLASTTVPHIARWQISLRYVEAMYWLGMGSWDRAIPALEACALSDALVFSPLLATKTVGASLMRGWMAAEDRNVEAARLWWTRGIEHAERALHLNWDEFLLSRGAPALFGLREAALVVDLASRCAAGLHLLPHLLERPGIVATQIFESLAERADRANARARMFERDLETTSTTLTSVWAELEATRAQVVSTEAQASENEARASANEARAEGAEREVTRLAALGWATRLLHTPAATLPPGLRFAIFGTGSGGRQALDMLRSRGGVVDCFTDNDASRHGTDIDGVPVVSPTELPARGVDVIAVASVPGCRPIVAQLAGMGYRLDREVVIVTDLPAGTPVDRAAMLERKKYEQMWTFAEYRDDHATRHASAALEILKATPGDSIIDFGAGAGYASRRLQDAGLRVLAIDIAGNAMAPEIAAAVPILIGNMWDIPVTLLGDWGFCCDVMEHIPTDRVHAVLRFVRTSTRRASYFSISLRADGCGRLIGDALHLTVRPFAWWMDQIALYWSDVYVIDHTPGEILTFVADGRPGE